MVSKRILVCTIAALALAGTAAASDYCGPPIIEPEPPVELSGDGDRYGYCVFEAPGFESEGWHFQDLLKDQPYLEPLDPRWVGKDVSPANVGLPGNPNAIWC